MSAKALSRTVFPIGNMLKADVRKMVLSVHNGKLERINQRLSSAGLCFVGRRRSFANFMDNFLQPVPGNFIDVDTGKVAGTHYGKYHYAVGQRVRISGVEKPYYVVSKQMENDTDILVAAGAGHPALYTRKVTTQSPFWIGGNPFDTCNEVECYFRFQHQHPLVKCKVRYNGTKTGLNIDLTERPMRAVSPGQYAVLYKNGTTTTNSQNLRCMGSARIINNRPSLLECGIFEHQPMHQTIFA